MEITAEGLSKRYGRKRAVADVSFTVRAGHVTGFLGPNGAGKSTTMRMLLGLDRPDAGTVLFGGRPLTSYDNPLQVVGSLLDAKAFNPRATARQHLTAHAATHGIGRDRVDAVLDVSGLAAVAGKRAGTFSLGMAQRLSIATAVLADPTVLVLDEPINGLDPDGVRWVRDLVRSFAADGRTVLLSSHLMSEMTQTADRVIVLGQGRIITDAPMSDVLDRSAAKPVRVRTPDLDALVQAVGAPGIQVRTIDSMSAMITGLSAESIGHRALQAGVVLYELVQEHSSLEDVYLELTAGAAEYTAGASS